MGNLISLDMVVGLLGGFAFSFILWWFLNHKLVPIVRFSEEVTKKPLSYGEHRFGYQFAVKNIGARSIINIRIKARLRIRDVRKTGTRYLNYYDIALLSDEIFEMKPGSMVMLSLLFNKSKSLESPAIDARLASVYDAKQLTLDDIFSIYPDAVVFVQLIGTDIYSNATKVFRSNLYSRRDVRLGRFRRRCLDVAPLSKNQRTLLK